MAESSTGRARHALRAQPLDCHPHVLRVGGLIRFPNGALKGRRGVVGSTQNMRRASCDHGLAFGVVLAVQQLQGGGMTGRGRQEDVGVGS